MTSTTPAQHTSTTDTSMRHRSHRGTQRLALAGKEHRSSSVIGRRWCAVGWSIAGYPFPTHRLPCLTARLALADTEATASTAGIVQIAPPAADVLPHVRSAEYQLLQIRCIPIILPIPSAALRYAVFITQHPNSIRWPASSLSHAPTQGLLPQPCKKPPFRKPKYLIHLATALTNALSFLLLPTAHSPLRFVHATRPLDPTNKTKVTKPTAAITRARLEKS
ncbi:uncharacterized protein CLUP02_14716 [Colletotrichum lupini]|uniref:Uncharacterized protein n=1 Tax=Colletotrichum lupini TaxID=145971 RepID=A0A9Q8T4R4_9PEZI|nr:uncharacterized protein CLUP02_14716 [Colletotrichum lupini]KAK1720556.1 hypothetical protein BDP67DRAFT_68941 [Colletotrichum lupini]UQC89188.1 hypothetical protein CLUP02_14716 [Colletotrichum lupini]